MTRFYADVYLTIEADDTDTARAVLDAVREMAGGFGALHGSTDVTTDDTDLYETRREIEGATDVVLDARTGEPAVGLSEELLEGVLDQRVQRRLRTDSAYLNAENAEEQAEREEQITREEEAKLPWP